MSSSGGRGQLRTIDGGACRELEKALIGACLTAPAHYHNAIDAGLDATMFADPACGTIFNAIDAVYEATETTDLVLVAEWLRSRDLLDTVGGEAELIGLQREPGLASAHYAAEIVGYWRDAALRAKLAEALNGRYPERWQVIEEAKALEASWNATTEQGYAWGDVALTLETGGLIGMEPTILVRTDNATALFYKGKINNIFGPSESCKSWIAQWACVEQLNAGEHVDYFDFEKDLPSVLGRLTFMGAAESDLIERFHYQRREQSFTDAEVASLRAQADAVQPSLVVFDGVTEAMRLEGLKILDNTDIAGWYNGVPHVFEVAGSAVVAVDHDVKDPESTTPGAIGGQHKRAGITGASYRMHLTQRPDQNRSGRGFLRIDKDALGHARSYTPDGFSIGDVVFTVGDGRMTVTIEPRVLPPVTKSARDVPRRTGYMDKVSQVLDAAGVAGSSVESARKQLQCRREYVQDALTCLVDEGYARPEGEGNKARYFHVKRFHDHLQLVDARYEKED